LYVLRGLFELGLKIRHGSLRMRCE
jgi:hypothetical protein